ncbi:MAG: hypothetical protein R3Y59_06310, partial [bacterium]
MAVKSLLLRNLFWIKDFLIGSPIRKQYCEIRNIFEQRGGFQKVEDESLLNILKYAVANTSYYKCCDYDNLKTFPVVNKAILIAHYDQIFVTEKNNPFQKDKSYHIQKTSGSTGTPFSVPFDNRKRLRRIAELKYFGKIVGYKSHDKLIQLRIWTHWQSKSKRQSFWENIIPFNIGNPSDENLLKLCNIINNERAISIRSYASTYDLIARYVKENNIKLPSLKVLIAGSEMLLDSTRELVKKNIGCNIVSQYANEENGILAQELPGDDNHKFFLNYGSYHFEILKFDSDEPAELGEVGRIVITDLFNYAFPIIRYDNGDNGVMEYDSKTQKKYISKIYGRRLDMIYDTVGNPV